MPVETRLAIVVTKFELQGVEVIAYMNNINMVVLEVNTAAVQTVSFVKIRWWRWMWRS